MSGSFAAHVQANTFPKVFCFLQQTYTHTFCLKNCFARVLPICNQIWFKSVAGAFAINFHAEAFVTKQVVGSFAANLQADTMSQTKQAHQAATTPAMASTGSQKNKRTKAPSSKKVGHNTLINRLICLKRLLDVLLFTCRQHVFRKLPGYVAAKFAGKQFFFKHGLACSSQSAGANLVSKRCLVHLRSNCVLLCFINKSLVSLRTICRQNLFR